MNKNIFYYLIIFSIYTFFGAHIEHLSYYVSDKKKSMENPFITGFPLYGICSLMILSIDHYIELNNIILEIIIFGSLITLIELIVGLYIGAGKDSYTDTGLVHAWDYSDNFLNYKGIISARHFLMWGILGALVIRAHPYISNFVINGLS